MLPLLDLLVEQLYPTINAVITCKNVILVALVIKRKDIA